MASQNSRVETVEVATNIFNTLRQITVSDTYNTDVDVILFDGDCSELLKNIPSNSVDLVITSPPYNIGKKYEKQTSLQSYLKSQESVIAEIVRVLAATGSLCFTNQQKKNE